MRKITSFLVLLTFALSCVTPPQGFAQSITAIGLMSEPGNQVALSGSFTPAHLKGMAIDLKDPFKFDFIIHRGDEQLTDAQKQAEYPKLIKYFLAALAIPDTDQWVNLSPYEQDRIIPDDFGLTEMGRDLLAQDYLLKQISASLTNPDSDLGKKFWDQVYSAAYEKLGTTQIPADTFNKVWIVPDKAVVYEKGNAVYVLENHLKVMLEADYLAMSKQEAGSGRREDIEATASTASDLQLPASDQSDLTKQIMREVIIPAIEKEVNEGKNFAPLRQVYSGMLLATWYKRALKETILGKLYADQAKVKGVDQDPKNNQEIYDQYVVAFKKGVFNMIKEDVDRYSQEVIPRKYFSGGTEGYNHAQITKGDLAQASKDFTQNNDKTDTVKTILKEISRSVSTTDDETRSAFEAILNESNRLRENDQFTAAEYEQFLNTLNEIAQKLVRAQQANAKPLEKLIAFLKTGLPGLNSPVGSRAQRAIKQMLAVVPVIVAIAVPQSYIQAGAERSFNLAVRLTPRRLADRIIWKQVADLFDEMSYDVLTGQIKSFEEFMQNQEQKRPNLLSESFNEVGVLLALYSDLTDPSITSEQKNYVKNALSKAFRTGGAKRAADVLRSEVRESIGRRIKEAIEMKHDAQLEEALNDSRNIFERSLTAMITILISEGSKSESRLDPERLINLFTEMTSDLSNGLVVGEQYIEKIAVTNKYFLFHGGEFNYDVDRINDFLGIIAAGGDIVISSPRGTSPLATLNNFMSDKNLYKNKKLPAHSETSKRLVERFRKDELGEYEFKTPQEKALETIHLNRLLIEENFPEAPKGQNEARVVMALARYWSNLRVSATDFEQNYIKNFLVEAINENVPMRIQAVVQEAVGKTPYADTVLVGLLGKIARADFAMTAEDKANTIRRLLYGRERERDKRAAIDHLAYMTAMDFTRDFVSSNGIELPKNIEAAALDTPFQTKGLQNAKMLKAALVDLIKGNLKDIKDVNKKPLLERGDQINTSNYAGATNYVAGWRIEINGAHVASLKFGVRDEGSPSFFIEMIPPVVREKQRNGWTGSQPRMSRLKEGALVGADTAMASQLGDYEDFLEGLANDHAVFGQYWQDMSPDDKDRWIRNPVVEVNTAWNNAAYATTREILSMDADDLLDELSNILGIIDDEHGRRLSEAAMKNFDPGTVQLSVGREGLRAALEAMAATKPKDVQILKNRIAEMVEYYRTTERRKELSYAIDLAIHFGPEPYALSLGKEKLEFPGGGALALLIVEAVLDARPEQAPAIMKYVKEFDTTIAKELNQASQFSNQAQEEMKQVVENFLKGGNSAQATDPALMDSLEKSLNAIREIPKRDMELLIAGDSIIPGEQKIVLSSFFEKIQNLSEEQLGDLLKNISQKGYSETSFSEAVNNLGALADQDRPIESISVSNKAYIAHIRTEALKNVLWVSLAIFIVGSPLGDFLKNTSGAFAPFVFLGLLAATAIAGLKAAANTLTLYRTEDPGTISPATLKPLAEKLVKERSVPLLIESPSAEAAELKLMESLRTALANNLKPLSNEDSEKVLKELRKMFRVSLWAENPRQYRVDLKPDASMAGATALSEDELKTLLVELKKYGAFTGYWDNLTDPEREKWRNDPQGEIKRHLESLYVGYVPKTNPEKDVLIAEWGIIAEEADLFYSRLEDGNGDSAMKKKGGIDFAQSNLDFQIKRDGNGVTLPVSQQNLDNIRIDGLIPVILEIRPAALVPLFSEAGGATLPSV